MNVLENATLSLVSVSVDRSHVFFLTFPSTWRSSEINSAFAVLGWWLRVHLLICIHLLRFNVFSGGVRIFWVDDSSAFVALLRRENAPHGRTIGTLFRYFFFIKRLVFERLRYLFQYASVSSPRRHSASLPTYNTANWNSKFRKKTDWRQQQPRQWRHNLHSPRHRIVCAWQAKLWRRVLLQTTHPWHLWLEWSGSWTMTRVRTVERRRKRWKPIPGEFGACCIGCCFTWLCILYM